MRRRILEVRRCPKDSHLLVCLSYLPEKREYVTSIYNIELNSHAYGRYYCLPYGRDVEAGLKEAETNARKDFEKRVVEYNAI